MIPVRADNISVFTEAQAALDEYNKTQTQQRWDALMKEMKESLKWWKEERARVRREGLVPIVIPVTQPPTSGPVTPPIVVPVTQAPASPVVPTPGNVIGFGEPLEIPDIIIDLLEGQTTGGATAPATPQPPDDGRPPLL